MYRYLRQAGLAAVAACGMLAVACTGGGGQRIPETGATLEGTVKYGDQTVEAAMIIVAGKDRSATGQIDEDTGRYRVDNVPVGEVRIGVNTDAVKGQMMGKIMSGYYKGPEAKAKGRIAPPKIVEVPPKFANPETSDITTTTTKGTNTFDIVIPKK
jgi:hypothetical protein